MVTHDSKGDLPLTLSAGRIMRRASAAPRRDATVCNGGFFEAWRERMAAGRGGASAAASAVTGFFLAQLSVTVEVDGS